MPDDAQTAIEDNAQQPRGMKGDEAQVEEHSLPGQIEADRYLASRGARGNPHKALRFAKLSPPGAA